MKRRSLATIDGRLLTRGRSEEGYTLIEVMMALTILAIGATGLFALQTAAIIGNDNAHDLTGATNVARQWMEIIRTDAMQWNSAGPVPPSDMNEALYLQGPAAGEFGVWTALVPPPGTGLAQATPMTRDDRFINGAPFCAQVRFTQPVMPPNLPPITGLIVTVRVWWFRGDYHRTDVFPNCGAGQEAAMTGDTDRFNWFYLTTMLTPHQL